MLSPSPLLLSSSVLRIAFALTLVGCVFDPSGADSAGDGGLPDAGFVADAPFDASTAPDGTPCTDTPPTCLGGQVLESCVDGQLEQLACGFGCLDTPAPHCGEPVLSNGLDLAWLEGAGGDVVVASGETWVFETSTGVVSRCGAGGEAAGNVHTGVAGIQQGINFQVRAAPTPGDLAIGAWAFDSLRIEAGGTLRVIGAVPGALVVRDDVRIEGVLDATAGVAACSVAAACGTPGKTDLRSCGGPGGGDGGAHDQDGFGPGHGAGGTSGGLGIDEIGGGGAAFGASGGASGGEPIGGPDMGHDSVPGGAAYGMPDLEPLIGGSGGGGGGESTPGAGVGGGGGGALQIVALDRIEVLQPSGILRAGGAGGGAGLSATGNGGGGGGSGGGLLLEAARVEVTSTMAANGGGGGGAGNDTALNGTDGLASASVAPGGTGLHAGGAGGAGGSAAGATGNPINLAADGTAGGGGGAGRIFVRALPGGIDLSGAIVSPAPGQGMLRVQ